VNGAKGRLMVKTHILMVALAAALTAACGGGAKHEDTTVATGDTGEGEGASGGGDTMVSPERMDEIKALLDRKRTIVARCLPDAIAKGQAEKTAGGRVLLEFVISPQGKAENIRVTETSIESEAVQECVKQHVANIDFGALPRSLDWSYAYTFEAY